MIPITLDSLRNVHHIRIRMDDWAVQLSDASDTPIALSQLDGWYRGVNKPGCELLVRLVEGCTGHQFRLNGDGGPDSHYVRGLRIRSG